MKLRLHRTSRAPHTLHTNMLGERPKLLIVSAEAGKAVALRERVEPIFDVKATTPEGLSAAMETGRFDFLLLGTQRFIDICRGLGQGRARELLDGLADGVLLADLDGRVLWCNDRFLRYDTSTQARIARACRQAVRTMSDPAARGGEARQGQGVGGDGSGVDAVQPAGPQADSSSRRIEVPGTDESTFLEVLVSPIFDDTAQPGGQRVVRMVAGVVSDVSVIRRRRQKQAAIERAGNELVRIDAETIRTQHTGERLRVLEQKIIRSARELLNFDHFAIRLIEPHTGKLELVMSKGLPSAAMELELFAQPDGNGISGYVASTGRSYLCQDTTTDPRYLVGAEGARSSLTVPLRLNDRVIGVFNVEAVRPNAFDEEDRQYAEMFVSSIALALHILNLLVVERVETGQTVGHNVEDELAEPIAELTADLAKLKDQPGDEAAMRRLGADLESLKRRVKDVTAGGGQFILGAEKALTDVTVDPIIAGKRVLVADDEPRIRQVIREVLSRRGAEVVVCQDAQSAIDPLHARAAGRGHAGPGAERAVGEVASHAGGFSLLISDIRLPDKTGYEIFAAAKQTNPGLPVILMTGFGYDPHHSIVRASQEGLQCVLFKPFQAERLIEEVHKALRRDARIDGVP
ncbi:MAG: GAF domain-containing protein [bacterium]